MLLFNLKFFLFNLKGKKSVMSRVFKRRHIEYADEYKVYISLPLADEILIYWNGGKPINQNFQTFLEWHKIILQYQPQVSLLKKVFQWVKI